MPRAFLGEPLLPKSEIVRTGWETTRTKYRDGAGAIKQTSVQSPLNKNSSRHWMPWAFLGDPLPPESDIVRTGRETIKTKRLMEQVP